MHEERHIRQVLVRNTLLFFVVFALLFALLGVLVYQTVAANIFHSVDQQLTALGADDITIGKTAAPGTPPEDEGAPAQPDGPEFVLLDAGSGIVAENPLAVYVFRDENGAPLDVVGLYASYPAYFADLPFDPATLGEVYSVVQDGRTYRGINTKVTIGSDTPSYLQAVINVDSEIAILRQFTQTLVVSLIAALILCAGASYLLSKKTIRPIAEAWRKQTEFVQNASHELRTPLAVISVTQELLLEDPHARIVDHFEDISLTLEETRRLAGLTEDLLLLTSIDSDTLPLDTGSFDLDGLLAETAALFDGHAAGQGKRIEADLRFGGPVCADRAKIRQVMNVLVDNALKYTEAGDAVTIASAAEPGKAVVTVADTGIGVSAETLGHAFDRFYREDKARSRQQGGQGLGLSIARGIIEAHGGTIEMRRNEPKGTCMAFTVPAPSPAPTKAVR